MLAENMHMLIIFGVVLSLVIAYFVARLALNIYYLKAKCGLQEGGLTSVLDSVNLLMYIVIALMLALSLTMTGDYMDKELPIIGVLCVLLVICIIIERVQLYRKHRGQISIFAYDIDLKKLSKSEDFCEMVSMDRNICFVGTRDLQIVKGKLENMPDNKAFARSRKKAVMSAISPLIPILLSGVVLALGFLRVIYGQ